jgi:hypothetical protein
MNQPQPPKGLDEDVEPCARKVAGVVCYKCKTDIMWDGRQALWCNNQECERCGVVCWNADLRETLEISS